MSNQHYINLQMPLRRLVPVRPLGWGLLSFFVPLMLLFAFQAVNTDPDIVQARIWFTQHHPTPKFWDVPVSPDWANARKVEHHNRKYYEVPLLSNTIFKMDIGNFDGSVNEQNASALKANGRVRVIIEQNAAIYSAYFLRVASTRNYLEANSETKVQSTNFDMIDPEFTGVIEYFGMDGYSLEGWYFKNGGAKTSIFSFRPGERKPADDRCFWCYTAYYAFYTTVTGTTSTGTPVSTTTVQYLPYNRCESTGTCYEVPFLPSGYYYYQYYLNLNGNNPTQPNGNNTQEKPCVLMNNWVIEDGPYITWSPLGGWLNICSAYTEIRGKLTDCKSGRMMALSYLTETGQINCGPTINRDQTVITNSGNGVNDKVAKTWTIETYNSVVLDWQCTFMGIACSGHAVGSNSTTFVFNYL